MFIWLLIVHKSQLNKACITQKADRETENKSESLVSIMKTVNVFSDTRASSASPEKRDYKKVNLTEFEFSIAICLLHFVEDDSENSFLFRPLIDHLLIYDLRLEWFCGWIRKLFSSEIFPENESWALTVGCVFVFHFYFLCDGFFKI